MHETCLKPTSEVPVKRLETFQRNLWQHCWPSICKPRQNDRNISTQHIATLLGETCCIRLATMLRRVVTFCEFKIELERMPRCNIVEQTCPNDYNIIQHPQMLRENFDHFQI